MEVPEIETPRLLLRAWRDGDVDAYAAINADPEVRRFVFPARPLTREEAIGEIETKVEGWRLLGFGHWAVELRATGELIGSAGVRRHADWDLDPDNTAVGCLLARSAWGSGLGTEGATAAVNYCLEELGRPEAIGIAPLGHVAAHRVMRKAGLEWAGVHRWYERGIDVLWYSSKGRPEKTEPRAS